MEKVNLEKNSKSIKNDRESEQFVDVMYAVLKYCGYHIVDINKFDFYITKTKINDSTSLIGVRFCSILEQLLSMVSGVDNLRWNTISKIMTDRGFLFPVPMKNIYTTFDGDVMYQRYYVVVNKVSIFDNIFDKNKCVAHSDKCTVRELGRKFVSTYQTASNEKIYLYDGVKLKKQRFNEKKDFPKNKIYEQLVENNVRYSDIAILTKYAKHFSSYPLEEQCIKTKQKLDEMWNITETNFNHSITCIDKIKIFTKNEDICTYDNILNAINDIGGY
ncbi:Hypothetical protein SRAE_1000236500 [Strongyloides ratti]|uniref:Uncharacterized protein n=1 Tax=Strongyloides ratti TaxID=34506 RepID=A0A090L9B4_STRRB|nr:Hypothetical protein SRAE_1000236500 [Strongyloides ratti]CEF64110.1 Hypothetical protein SRAE_1000236500 [Strongyloides ratti]